MEKGALDPIMDSATFDACVVGALTLRQAVLPQLASPAGATWPEDTMRTSSARAWWLFLRAECCAMTLGARLRDEHLLPRLPAPIREIVGHAEIAELQRVLAARETLRQVDAIAHRHSIDVVVFKGAVAADGRGRRAVDLADVDVIVRSESIPALWEALVTAGWRAKELPLTPSNDELASLPQLPALHPPVVGLPVEIHRSVPYAMGASSVDPSLARPMAGYHSLHCLQGVDAFAVLLRHCVVQHPPRRGHVRDLIFLADELSCDPDLSAERVAMAIRGDLYEPELRDMLSDVENLRTGKIGAEPRNLLTFVAWKYEFVLRQSRPMPRFTRDCLSMSHLALERAPVRRTRLAAEIRDGVRQTPLDARIRGERYGLVLPSFLIRATRWLYRTFVVLSIVATGGQTRTRAARLVELATKPRDGRSSDLPAPPPDQNMAAPGIPLA